jgi:hypothetical protein
MSTIIHVYNQNRTIHPYKSYGTGKQKKCTYIRKDTCIIKCKRTTFNII